MTNDDSADIVLADLIVDDESVELSRLWAENRRLRNQLDSTLGRLTEALGRLEVSLDGLPERTPVPSAQRVIN